MNVKKLLLIIAVMCLCFIPVAYAAEEDITVSSVSSVSVSEGVESSVSDSIDLEFNDLGQTAKYEVTLKNNTKKDVYINELEVEGASKSFVKYVLDSKSIGKVLKANSSEKFTLLLSTQNEKGAGENFSDDISLKLMLNKKIVNPATSRNNIISVILLIVVGAVAITFITLKFNNRRGPLTVAVVCFMLLGISLTYADDTVTVSLGGKVSYTSQNLLESSGTVINNAKADYTNSKDVWAYNDKVKNITISHELYEASDESKIDLTIDDKNRVSGYLLPSASDGNYYDLYIAANGVIYAPEDSTALFSFPNVETITGLENVRFDKTTKMTGMFIGDEKLKTMDMSTLKTDNVTDVSYMFHKCVNLDLSNVEFNLDNVENKTNMFVQYLYDVVKKDTVSDVGTDFSTEPVTGKYIVNSTINDEYPVYYYRGAIEDNNVRFANFCWKMVRTTETGGIKLIYNGVPAADGSCNNTGEASQIGTSAFNERNDTENDVRYIYADGTDSVIKGVIDTWYTSNMTSYTEKLEDTPWCNDRKVDKADDSNIHYEVYERNVEAVAPSVLCDTQYQLTVSSSLAENRLKYPVALLTADELTLAGMGWSFYSEDAYLNNYDNWWSLSPFHFWDVGMFLIRSEAHLGYGGMDSDLGVRPAISLKNGIDYLGGTGTVTNPYVVE